MFKYNLKKLKAFTIPEHAQKMNGDAVAVIVRIKQFDTDRDEKTFLDWLEVGCRQISGGAYEIKKL